MTNTRVDHRDHDHANTPAARAACRRRAIKARMDPITARVAQREQEIDDAFNIIVGAHCQACGSTNPEYTSTAYTGCCNELVVDTCDGTRCYHA